MSPSVPQHPIDVSILVGGCTIAATLQVPAQAKGLVLFAHGSGSSRYSPRNRFVAETLNAAGLGTMLLDLLTAREDEIDRTTAQFRFDIGLLAERLIGATRWVRREDALRDFVCGYFGASTGAAAAIEAAASLPDDISAIVSRGGRPDLAPRIGEVRAPTLLIVGGSDPQTLALNRQAILSMHMEYALAIVPNATHLFEEPGALAEVSQLAASWFLHHLGTPKLQQSARSLDV